MKQRDAHGERWLRYTRDAPFYAASLVGPALGLLPGAVKNQLAYGYAVGLTALIGVSIAVVPWHRLPPAARALPALTYFLVIWMLQHSNGMPNTGYGPLTVIPVIWLALYGNRTQMIVASAATAGIFGAPLLDHTTGSAVWLAAFRLFALWSLMTPTIGFTLRHLIARSRLEYSRSEAILRAATEHSIIGSDAAGRITVYNAGAQRMLGYRAEEMIGKATPMIFHDPAEIVARSQELGVAPGFEVFFKSCQIGTAHAREWSYIRKDGTRLTVMLSVAPLRGPADEICGYVFIAVDVSGLREAEASLSQSEHRYRALGDATSQMIWVLDDAGRLEYANELWCNYTGLTLEDGVERGAQSVVHPDQRATLERSRLENNAERRAGAFELQIRRTDGAYRWHLVRTVALDGGARGTGGQWIVSAIDIEERKTAEATLAVAHQRALEGSAAKTRFLATMSHEIRTPMSGIIGMCELLLSMPLGTEERETATVIHDSGKILLRIMSDILDFTKMDAGKLALEAVSFDIGTELQAVVGLQAAQAAQKRIGLRTTHDPAIPQLVLGDAGRLRQILLNLVSNGIKFTPNRGSVEITTRLHAVRLAMVEVEFRVSDTGSGIPIEARATIFDPFVQADGTITRRHGGTGLGLTICKQLVELMGGTIAIEPAAAAGTSMLIVLPFATAAAPAAGASSAQPRPGHPTPYAPAVRADALKRTTLRPERILLAEDNPINAILATKQLRHLGFETVVAINGLVAVEQWKEHPYDLILMDCHMPELDGYAATRAIRRFDRDHPQRRPAIIVAMTADARAQDREACTAAGMNDYIAKPAELADIDRILGRWLGPHSPSLGLQEAVELR